MKTARQPLLAATFASTEIRNFNLNFKNLNIDTDEDVIGNSTDLFM